VHRIDRERPPREEPDPQPDQQDQQRGQDIEAQVRAAAAALDEAQVGLGKRHGLEGGQSARRGQGAACDALQSFERHHL
jgi:hypothetical protein